MAVWPAWELLYPSEAPLLRLRPAEGLGLWRGPSWYNFTGTERPSHKANRKFFLDRSVFDLVDAHRYLSLTDPQLLGWYLHLSPEDRKIIQDDGGFHQFLQRHPALELSQNHVYVKYLFGSSSPALPTFTPGVHTFRTAGSEKCRCGATHSHLELETSPGNVRELCGGSSNGQDGSQKHLQEGIGHAERLDDSQTGCSSLTDVSVELDRRQQRDESELRSTNFTAAAEDEFPSQYYSFCRGAHMDDGGFVQPAELQHVCSSLDSVGKSVSKAGSQDQMVSGDNHTAEDQTKNIRGIMKDDNGILAYQVDEDVKGHGDEVHVDPVSADSEATSGERLKSDQAVSKMKDTAEKYTSTELPPSTSAFTQTEDPGTSDKNVITEVHMADLDYVAEEFIKLKMAQEELRERKQTVKRPKNPPANVQSVLRKLERDYNQMRDKILAGVPLEQLQPLCVDSEKITTGASCIPAQIVGDVSGNAPSWSSEEPQEREEKGRLNNQSKHGSEHSTKKEKQIKMENGKERRAVTVPPREAACKEHSACEAWYDAEEDLQPARPAAAAEPGQEVKGSALCVSNLPSDVTEPPLSCSIESGKLFSVSPTAKGTFVPEHYGTMGSFDTLMEELTRLHPDVGRQKMVDALIELRAEHGGVLSSLPLATIREMTSELLSRPTSAAQTRRLNF